MHPPISPSDLATLIDETDVAARRLHRKLTLPAADLDDLRQDLLIDLICRLPGFDKRRGAIGAFANIVLRNQCSRIAIRHHRQRRAHGGTMLSLDAPAAGSVEPLSCLLAESDGLAAWHGQDRDTQADIQTREAVQSALARLPEADRRFCCALAHRSVPALAAEGFGSRSALYRHLADLRHVLTAYGLGPSWDDLAAA
jgi:DNA-directed RNA polymerase specialized sigma24 family protein